VLEIRNLKVAYHRQGRRAPAVCGVDLDVTAGRAVALVGESGSGKTTLAMSVLRLVNPPIGRIEGGSIRLDGVELLDLRPDQMRHVLHEDIGYVPQDPTVALDPLCTIGRHVDETLSKELAKSGRRAAIAELLESLGITDAAARLRSYPHELSGGMRQRVAIAVALARQPKLLIADEPTTALDVTTQVGILRLIDRLRRERDLALLFVTHDLSVARLLCQDVAVMYAGKIVEWGPLEQVMDHPRHPYTQALIGAIPGRASARSRLLAIPGQPPMTGFERVGCPFVARCPIAGERCANETPPVEELEGARAACWKVGAEAAAV
jgi:oligopeptide/dipeptide ABC transporter ATP-binding protein